jgi:DNA polymerase theta
MLKNVFETRRKAIMILPFVSIAKEKLKYLQWLLSESFVKADGFIGSSSPNGGFNSIDIAICTIEKANSLINRLIEDELFFELGTIVVDELHMVNDNSRGYILELILSKIKFLSMKNPANFSKIQIIGMSATLPNLKVLAEWLNANLYETDFRPVALVECIKYETDIYDKNHQSIAKIKIDPRIENDPELIVHLVLETIFNKFGVLIFCPTKSRCEALAENVARVIYNLEKSHGEVLHFLNKEKIIECITQLKNTPAGLDSQLAKTIRYGIAFHHAGLTVEEREIVESHFKLGHLLVIVCTSTLSSGINFPARRVIIRTPIFNGRPIDTMSYKQMVGRAGRKGIDTSGESIIMCSNQAEKRAADILINSSMMPQV